MDQQGKTLATTTADWIAAVVSSKDGWPTKRGLYRARVIPELDPVMSWIDRSYRQSSKLPPYSTTKQRFPTVPWPKDVLPEAFAILELEQAYRRYDVIQHVRELERLLTEGTTNEAYQLAQTFSAQAITGDTAFGIQLTDPALYEQQEEDSIPLPSWGDAMAERPVCRGDFVLLAARTGVGKSWLLLMAALDAIQVGWDVVFYSLEMSSDEQAKRLRMLLKMGSAKQTTEWLADQLGRMYVIDQGAHRRGFTPGDLVKRVDKGSNTLIIVDYGELIRPESGGRTTEGWNKSAEVSQALQNVAKHVEVPVMAAVQDNRAAVGTRPGVETLSGSDYWGRDADTVLRLRDETGEPPGVGPTRILEVVKSRHTGNRTPTFYEFAPNKTGVTVIDRVQYASIHARE
jgi:DnaB helicase-like protein